MLKQFPDTVIFFERDDSRAWPQKLDHKLRWMMEQFTKPVEGQNDGLRDGGDKPQPASPDYTIAITVR